MDAPSTFARIAGSALAGAVGFLVGFYGGLFLVLSISGLETGELGFVLVTGGLGILVGGTAIAWTVSKPRKWAAFLTTLGLGLALILIVLVFDLDAAAMAVGAVVLVLVTSAFVRTGTLDALTG